MRSFIWAAAIAAAFATSAQAHSHGSHGGQSRPAVRGQHSAHAMRPAGSDTAATREYKAAHERMMRNMSVPYTGDPDVDLRAQMIPHHEGAIDMARVALRHAKDPWTRQLAEAIIVEQQREIAEMKAWLSRRGVAVPVAGQPRHVIRADSYRAHTEEPGTFDEARGQSWAPGSGAPNR